jgi:nucleoside-diphosphate-sugar epimerase
MKVALTGATGFVGSHVLTALHKSGHDVMALVRAGRQLPHLHHLRDGVPCHCGSPSCLACSAASQKAEMTTSRSASHLLV